MRSHRCILLLILLSAENTNTAHAFIPSVSTSASSSFKVLKAATPTVSATTTNTILEATTNHNKHDRRSFLSSIVTTASITAATTLLMPQSAQAEPKKRYLLDNETGEYVESIDDGDWQKDWKSRYEQISTMSRDEVFTAARGAGNIDSKDLENETIASKKRRAFSGCRDKPTRTNKLN
eukprot:CAMPEP_0197833780 /NCGR_PEP_ID=MMETSP1437-20131217/20091_1 /TAXON_ID=49252 ORGANISM="Eucampia antarctica, Strain CCMP1452" /NCGR_SAMPLE_ID=MMETSP1437 /ASSEMBLY_ACC=CAM_ASM_001096 /LENGTH=178 /DNA_ID=CAMNT_0043438037 /DNA_START=111 /DNA_END=644 /DNA_ORIENTATION=+